MLPSNPTHLLQNMLLMEGHSWYEMEKASLTVYMVWHHGFVCVLRLGQEGSLPWSSCWLCLSTEWKIEGTKGLHSPVSSCSSTHYAPDSQSPRIPCLTSPKLDSRTIAGLSQIILRTDCATGVYTFTLQEWQFVNSVDGAWMCRLGCPHVCIPGLLW